MVRDPRAFSLPWLLSGGFTFLCFLMLAGAFERTTITQRFASYDYIGLCVLGLVIILESLLAAAGLIFVFRWMTGQFIPATSKPALIEWVMAMAPCMVGLMALLFAAVQLFGID